MSKNSRNIGNDVYNPGDPFFVVVCKNCSKENWSTRRVNSVCICCGSSNISTHIPEHTIKDYNKTRK